MSEENDVGLALDYHESAESLAVLMSSGVPEITFDEGEAFKLTIRPEDSEDVQDVKKSVEFTINTAQEMISVLKRFAIQTGNPRFFETINGFLATINGSIGKLVDMKKATNKPEKDEPKKITNIQNNFNTGQPMTARDAIRSIPEPIKLINATVEKI